MSPATGKPARCGLGRHGSAALKLLIALALVFGCSPLLAYAVEEGAAGGDEGSPAPSVSSSSSAEPAKPPSSSSSSQKADEADDAGVDPDPEPTPDKYYVNTLLLKWDKPDDDGITHFVGDSDVVEEGYRKISITEFGEEVQLNGWYLSTDGTGVAYQTVDSGTRIGSFDLTWKSSDESVATVNPSGLVTPKGKNGTVKITATVADEAVYEGSAPTATVTIAFDGQDGKYVEKVEILDDAGNGIGEAWGGVTVYTDENAFHQLHARVTWRYVSSGEEEVQVTGIGEDYDAKAVGTTLTWGVSASNTFTINEDTGRLRTGAKAGNAYVTCKVVGGLGGATVEDTANVQLDTGHYEYDPAESLNLKVVWEEEPDKVVAEKTFSYEDLKSKLSDATMQMPDGSQSDTIYSTVVNNTRYGLISAKGWLFKDVVGLVAGNDAKVLQYRFSTRDGYDNPVSYDYLYGIGADGKSSERYYFPNYDIGSKAGGVPTPPILAYESVLEWERSEANPSATLDDGNRFRLVFGCLWDSDANTSFQIYYITGITIVLKGAPPVEPGAKDPAKGDDQGDGRKGGPGKGGKGKGGRGHGKGSGKPGDGSGGGSDADGSGDGEKGANDIGDDAGAATFDDPEGVGDAKRWRVYQMMNKNNADVPDWDEENPLSPFAIPIAAGTFAVGAGATAIGFRRRL